MENIIKHEMNCPFNPTSNVDVSKGHKEMIELLKQKGYIRSTNVENGMLAVDRALFCSSLQPYVDKAKRNNYGTTISAPHMHARILELMKSKLTAGAKALDVGSGSGYLTVCMAMMLGSDGKVIGVDHVSQLTDQSISRIRQYFSFLSKSRIEFVTSDGRAGFPSESPYDVINIGGALDEVPQEFIDQLKPNGRIIVPLRCANYQKLVTVDKTPNGDIIKKERLTVRFGPITDLESQLNGFQI